MKSNEYVGGPASHPGCEASVTGASQALLVDRLLAAASVNDLRYQITGVARISLGDRVSLFSLEESTHYPLELVAPGEADPDRHRISCCSPLGRAMLGRREGENFSVMIFGRRYRFVVFDLVKRSRGEACEGNNFRPDRR